MHDKCNFGFDATLHSGSKRKSKLLNKIKYLIIIKIVNEIYLE